MANTRDLQSAIEALTIQPSNVRVLQSAIQLLTIPGPIQAFCNNPPNGIVGQAYSTTFTQAGATLPVTWTLIAGSFPTGLTLNASTGILSGTPSAPGTFTFTLQLTDAASNMTQITCNITIGTAPVITCNNPPQGTVGVFYSQQFGLSGGTPPYTVTLIAGAFPPGLSMPSGAKFLQGSPYFISGLFPAGGISFAPRLDAYQVILFSEVGEGVLNGIPTAPGTYTFTLQITDALGATATVTCSITIVGAGGSPCQTGGPG